MSELLSSFFAELLESCPCNEIVLVQDNCAGPRLPSGYNEDASMHLLPERCRWDSSSSSSMNASMSMSMSCSNQGNDSSSSVLMSKPLHCEPASAVVATPAAATTPSVSTAPPRPPRRQLSWDGDNNSNDSSNDEDDIEDTTHTARTCCSDPTDERRQTRRNSNQFPVLQEVQVPAAATTTTTTTTTPMTCPPPRLPPRRTSSRLRRSLLRSVEANLDCYPSEDGNQLYAMGKLLCSSSGEVTTNTSPAASPLSVCKAYYQEDSSPEVGGKLNLSSAVKVSSAARCLDLLAAGSNHSRKEEDDLKVSSIHSATFIHDSVLKRCGRKAAGSRDNSRSPLVSLKSSGAEFHKMDSRGKHSNVSDSSDLTLRNVVRMKMESNKKDRPKPHSL